MGHARPELATILARIRGDISSRTAGSAFIKYAPERKIGNSVGGVAHGLHGHLDWTADQLLPTTCEIDGLLEWGAMLELPRTDATQAVLTATFTGTNTTALPTDTALQGADGAAYTVTTGGVVSAGSVTVTVTADVAGADGNLDNGATLSLASPIAGIDTDGLVASTVTSGTDVEDVEDYRERILDEIREPESGGGPGDYVKWAKEVAGVTRAWEFGNRMGYGTVSLAFVRDGDSPSTIPDAGEVTAVQTYIDSKRPLDMRAAYVQAPVAVTVAITVSISPNTLAVRNAITAELQELFRTEAELETSLPLSQIDEAISIADGEVAHDITSIGSLVPGDWGLLVLGTITFNTL
jgi:uncharacterized phage protein gp47/JayE